VSKIRFYFEGPYLIIAAVIWIIVVAYLKFKCKYGYPKIIFLTLFYIYICELLKYTQFPITYVPDLMDINRVWDSVNLIPFRHFLWDPMNGVLNVILTMPYGFLLPILRPINHRKILVHAIVLPIFLEGLQLLIGILCRYTERIIDVTDVIFNFLGVLIGFFVYILFVYFLKLYVRGKKVKLDPLIQYVIKK